MVPLTLLTFAVIRAFLFFFSKYLSFTTLFDGLDKPVKAENAPDEAPVELLPNWEVITEVLSEIALLFLAEAS